MVFHFWIHLSNIICLKRLAYRSLIYHHERNHLNYAIYTFIAYPVFIIVLECSVIEGRCHVFGLVVVDFASAVEFILVPHFIICYLSRLIVQFAMTIHLILTPISLIISSFLIVISPKSISHPIFCVTDIFASILCFLSDELSFLH